MEAHKRMNWLDIARGICICNMVICHIVTYSGIKDSIKTLLVFPAGPFFLLFFCLSAGICFNKCMGMKPYALKQFKKLVIPYLLTNAVILFFQTFRSGTSLLGRIKTIGIALIWALPSRQNIGSVTTMGVSPTWFLLPLFVASLLYKSLYTKRYASLIITITAIASSVSQTYICLPFALQDALIFCFLLLVGDHLKGLLFHGVDWLEYISLRKLVSVSACSTVSYLLTIVLYRVICIKSQIIINPGENMIPFPMLIETLLGSCWLIVISVLLGRTKIIDELLAFCGKESFLILVFHSLDISLLRKWGDDSITFIGFTLMIYPLMVYLYRRTQRFLRNIWPKDSQQQS